MKALSLNQPWAQLLAMGIKTKETRSWSTDYRGAFYIHASKKFTPAMRALIHTPEFLQYADLRNVELPTGAIIGAGEILNVVKSEVFKKRYEAFMSENVLKREGILGDLADGRYVWEISNPRLLAAPIPFKGALSLFKVDLRDLRAQVPAIEYEIKNLEQQLEKPYRRAEKV